ncbi:MAG: hypothetical protein Q8916_14280 [Bacteroidota bacterium]|nr:hypothetical protein [Bacteroidota bacterium]MDP4231562.1 hypothetical protein [Bacteroidota bacterium]
MLFALPLRAQDRPHTYLGILGSYQYGSPTALNRDLGVIQTFGANGAGLSWDNAFSAGIYLQMPRLFSSQFGLSIRAGYLTSSGVFKSNYFETIGAVKDFRIISNTEKIECEVTASYALSSKFFVATGLWGNYRIKNDISQHLESIDPPGKDTIISSGDAISTSAFHYGIPLIIGGRFPLSNLFSVNTEAFASVDLGELARGFAKQSLSAGIRIGFSIATDAPQPAQAPHDLGVPALTTSVHFTTNGRSIRSVIAHSVDTITTSYEMLPAVITLQSGSADLPSGLHAVSHPFQFDLTSVEAGSARYELLNIIGKRMQEMPESSLTIIAEPAERLAGAIEQYLRNTWQIQGARIKHSSERGSSGSCILSDNGKLLSPVVREVSERTLSIPPIGLSRFISSEAGVRSWNATIRDGEKVIVHFSGEDSSAEDEMVRTLQLGSNDAGKKLLIADLHVTDVHGSVKQAFDTLEVRLPLLTENPIIVRKDIFVLLADSTANSLAWITPLKEKITRIICRRSIIRIQPFSASALGSIRQLAGKFLSELKLAEEPESKIEIISTPFLNSKQDTTSSSFESAFVVTIVTRD